MTWGRFKRRISVDIKGFPRHNPKIEEVVSDWRQYQCDEIADLILCMQVLEHLEDEQVKPFAQKIIRLGRLAIISVPYMWEKGMCKYHCQDPIDLQKLEGWVGCSALKHVIVEEKDKLKRLIALFKGPV